MEKAIEDKMREAYKEESKEYDFHYSVDEIIFTLNIIDYLEHGNISEEVALTLFSLDDMFEYYSKNKEYDVSSFEGIEIFIDDYLKNRKESSDEYIGFEEETLEKDSREVYSMAGQIKFYTDVMNYLEYGDIKVRDLEKIKSLKDLYYFYMESDDYIVGRFEDTQNLIKAYIKRLEEN